MKKKGTSWIRQTIFFYIIEKKDYKFIKKDLHHLIKCELQLGGNIVNSTSLGGQIVRGAVGAALFGVPGALIGGMTAESTSHIKKANQAIIRLFFNDTETPFVEVSLGTGSFFLWREAVTNQYDFEKSVYTFYGTILALNYERKLAI